MTEKNRPNIACIYAYNEEKNIAKHILMIGKYIEKIIVCDDGSTDMTGEIASALGATVIRNKTKLGYNASLKDMFTLAQQSQAKFTLTINPNDGNNPANIPKLIERLEKRDIDIVIGSKYQMDLVDQYGNYSYTDKNIKDVHSFYRAYNSNAIGNLNKTMQTIELNQETMIVSARMMDLKLVEIPLSIEPIVEIAQSKQTPKKTKLPSPLKTIFINRPLIFLGVPGLILILIAFGFLAGASMLFINTRYFSINMIMLATVFSLIGFLIIIISLALRIIISENGNA